MHLGEPRGTSLLAALYLLPYFLFDHFRSLPGLAPANALLPRLFSIFFFFSKIAVRSGLASRLLDAFVTGFNL